MKTTKRNDDLQRLADLTPEDCGCSWAALVAARAVMSLDGLAIVRANLTVDYDIRAMVADSAKRIDIEWETARAETGDDQCPICAAELATDEATQIIADQGRENHALIIAGDEACKTIENLRREITLLESLLATLVTASEALLDWGREHTSPTDANSPHELLIAVSEARAKIKAINSPLRKLAQVVRCPTCAQPALDVQNGFCEECRESIQRNVGTRA